MILLPLEELLEKGLIKFERRIYSEEVRSMVEVAEEFGEETIEERQKKLIEGAKLGQNEFGAALLNNELSPEQLDMLFNEGQDPSFFTREGLYKKWKIEYSVDVDEELGSYREHADRLIKEGKVCYQSIGLDFNGSDHLRIYVNGRPARPNTVDVEHTNLAALFEDCREDDEEIAQYFREHMEQFLALKELHTKPFEPEKLYKAIMDFIKC